LSSLLSGAGNGAVIGLVVFWWRRSGGAAYSLRELLPGNKELMMFGAVLLDWYLFWGGLIKREAIPAILPGQLTVWLIYAALLWIFYRCLLRSRKGPAAAEEKAVSFTWRGFFFCVAVATAVTTLARLWLHQMVLVQMAVFFTFYTLTGLTLLAGATLYASKQTQKSL
jgi:hypothetical protein